MFNKYLIIVLGSILLAGSLFAQSRQTIDSLEWEIELTVNNKDKIGKLLYLAELESKNDYESAILRAKEAYDFSELENNKENKLAALILIAKIYSKQQNKETLSNAIQANELAKDIDEQQGIAESLLLMSKGYLFLQDFDKSSTYVFEALHLFEKLKDSKGICNSNHAIGVMYYQLGEYEKSKSFILKSINIAQKNYFTYEKGRAFENLGVILGTLQDFEKAIEYFKASIKEFNKIGETGVLPNLFNNISQTYIILNNQDSALKYLNKVRQIENLDTISKAYNYYNFLHFYYLSGNEQLLIKYADSTFKFCKGNNTLQLRYNTTNLIHQFYREKDNLDSANRYCILLLQLKDSLDYSNFKTTLSNQEFLYNLKSTELEKQYEQKRRNLFIILFFVILLVILGFMILLLQRYRLKIKFSKLKQHKLQDELSFKNKELTQNVMLLIKNNTTFSEISQRLLNIGEKATDKSSKDAMLKLSREIEKTTDRKFWEEFEIRFKEVHTEFYERLNQQYPNLTRNEIRLCAFLKLNFSTKEISSITGQTDKAIDLARHRLRKKFGISNTSVSLSLFITNL